MVPKTIGLLWLSFVGVIASAGMQFCLAWYLWISLPQSYPLVDGRGAALKPYPLAGQTSSDGTYDGGRGYYDTPSACNSIECMSTRVPLPAYQFPDYKFANDICRTATIIQIVCIGLFLFNVLNNVPGLIKNFLVILQSEKFISKDEEGITKIHYWRQSDFTSQNKSDFLLTCLADSRQGISKIFEGCDTLLCKDGLKDYVRIEELSEFEVVGIYFSGHWCGPCVRFTPVLRDAYSRLKAANKSFEVVFVSSDHGIQAFEDYYKEMPWKALPFDKKRVNKNLNERFRVEGIPSLVLLNGKTGEIISANGRDEFEVNHEKICDRFPWTERKTAATLLRHVDVVSGGCTQQWNRFTHKDVVIGLLFTQGLGLECFDELRSVVNVLRQRKAPFEILVVPEPKDAHIFEDLGWSMIEDAEDAQNIAEEFMKNLSLDMDRQVQMLVLLEGDTGHIISKDGRQAILSDPSADHFPWKSLNSMDILFNHCDLWPVFPGQPLVPAWKLGSAGVVAIYFCSARCAACVSFTPLLAAFHAKTRGDGKSFQLVIVEKSGDENIHKHMLERGFSDDSDILFLPNQARKKTLWEDLKVSITPTLVLCDGETGEIITSEGRLYVLMDPEGIHFPWREYDVVSPLCDYLKGYDQGKMMSKFSLQLTQDDYGKIAILSGLKSIFSTPISILKGLIGLMRETFLQDNKGKQLQMTRGFLEVIETRNFVAEILKELSDESTVDTHFRSKRSDNESAEQQQNTSNKEEVMTDDEFRQKIKVKLIRADFLNPIDLTSLSWIEYFQILLLGIPTMGILWWALFRRYQSQQILTAQSGGVGLNSLLL